MPGIEIAAPAKLNLCLLVGDRRSDGFHGIESLFLALAFGDTLRVETAPQQKSLLELRTDWQPGTFLDELLPPESNIVSRAVSLFRDRSGWDTPLAITIEKRIPLGGGLGGGSSDAAATLLALNRLASPDGDGLLSGAALAEMGAALGSDVSFFLLENAIGGTHTAAWVSGRGEIVRPLALPPGVSGLSFVLINPGFPSNTAQAFRLLDEWRLIPRQQLSIETYLRSFTAQPRDWQFSNDFLPVFIAASEGDGVLGKFGTAFREILDALGELGADFTGLSGSGSTCFGVFSEPEKADLARESLLPRWPLSIVTFSLARRVIRYYN